MTTRQATGRIEARETTTYLVLERTFRAPAEAVWAAVTEPERLARWIGTWTGDPAAGEVTFRMLYEGDDLPPESMRIDACDPPRHLAVTSEMPYDADTGADPGATWQMALDLSEADGLTTLRFTQSLPVPEMAESVGPGWEYYLDRLVAAEDGGEAAPVVWDDCYPALREPYKALVARAT
jgi:uncharacterized protein YndB with AHSA1/START domain